MQMLGERMIEFVDTNSRSPVIDGQIDIPIPPAGFSQCLFFSDAPSARAGKQNDHGFLEESSKAVGA